MAESQPIRALPAHPSIEFLKKTAKERLDALRRLILRLNWLMLNWRSPANTDF